MDKHKRYVVTWGKIGGARALVYLDTRLDAQQLGEGLQRTFLRGEIMPSKFATISARTTRWCSELPSGEYVEVADTKRSGGWR